MTMLRKRKITWIVVADASRARLYRAQGREGWVLLWEQDHPASRSHPSLHEYMDEAGFSHTETLRHDGPATGVAPHDHAAQRFAHQIADLVDDGRRHGLFDELILIAAPHFLGLVRAALTLDAARMVRAALPKDLSSMGDREVRGRLMAEGLAR